MRAARLVSIYRTAAELLLVVLALDWLLNISDLYVEDLLGLWNLVAFSIVFTRWLTIRQGRKAGPVADNHDWIRTLSGRRLGFFSTIVSSLLGLSAGFFVTVLGKVPDQDKLPDDGTVKALALVVILLAWALLHFGFADRYAYQHYENLDEPGVEFPVTSEPNELDFTYFAFTTGATFATSDVTVLAHRIRYTMVIHLLMSFFYNAAILSIAISTFTGK